MNRRSGNRRSGLAALLLGFFSVLLIACDGESQPFEESVEIRDLQITALNVTPPANARESIILNVGENAQFGISGLRANGTSITLSGTGRQWFVSNAATASINRNGLLSATADGAVSVSVRIGDLVSAPFALSVNTQPLMAIEQIQGASSIERCLPQNYTAVGRFGDNSLRNLRAVNWSLADDDQGQVTTNDDATATVNGQNAGELTLNATVGAISANAPLSITVENTLSALDVSPSPARVNVDESLSFTATGTYNDQPATDTTPASGTRRVVITESVEWSITSGSANASVSNDAPNKGRVTGIASGNTVLSARCGDLADVQTVVVSDADDDDTDQLSFNTTDNPLVILRTNTAGFRLRVSTGSEFSSDNEVTDQVSWDVDPIASTTTPINLLETGSNVGLIRPLAIGEANITATHDGQSISIRVSVRRNP